MSDDSPIRRPLKSLTDGPDITVVSDPATEVARRIPVSRSTDRIAFAEASKPAVPAVPEPPAGERFGKYLLVGELACGGMAELFLAVHHGVEGFVKVVALKRILPHLSRDENFTRMFVDEARLTARIDHPHIVRTYEFGEQDGQYYSVMEYLPGEDLVKILNRTRRTKKPMSFGMAASIMSQVCNGLHFAHQFTDLDGRPLGLVHRDVSPANIILTYSGEVKLIDFGVAKSNTNASTTVGSIKGKVAYMSPEQLQGRGVDCRSDVFAAGIVLWELITEKPLFARNSEAETLHAAVNEPIPAPETLRPDVPPELSAIAMRALARHPKDRFQTAEAMQIALDEFVATQPKLSRHAMAQAVEQLFGRERAQAKQAIAQSRSLTTNVSLVMKLRSEVRSSVSTPIATMSPGTGPHTLNVPAPASASRTRIVLAVMAAVVAALAAVLVLLPRGGSPSTATSAAPAGVGSLTVESSPPGAAIFIAGEPTGMVTPSTLVGLRAGALPVRVALAGHGQAEAALTIAPGDHLIQRFELVSTAVSGRLIVAGLPSGASVFVDGDEHLAGELITLPGGRHDVRIVVAGRTVVQQPIDTGGGDQTWELQGDQLVRR